jgi:hypothetical protein
MEPSESHPLQRSIQSLLAIVIAALVLPACVASRPIGTPVPVASAESIRAGIRSANSLMVYEGLPHQAKEPELLEQELKRRDVTRIADYPFYTPGAPAKDRAALQRILGNANHFSTYTGPKTCGGFHPDYAITWRDRGSSYHVLICFGCGEVLISDGQQQLPYDIKRPAWAELRALLAEHSSKRPQATR